MITHVTERETVLADEVRRLKGRYHSQLAMAALYEACGLPHTKPISGEKS